MTVMTASLAQFVNDLLAVTAVTKDPQEIVSRVRPLTQEFALAKTWLEPRYHICDPEQGFGIHRLASRTRCTAAQPRDVGRRRRDRRCREEHLLETT
jgi:hypothetical protein